MVTCKKINSEEVLQKAFQIREEVFVNEQNVPKEEEYDEFEKSSSHFIAYFNNEIAGTSRWRTTEKGIKLERFAVLKPYRSKGVGYELLKTMLEDINTNEENKTKQKYLHSQVTAVNLYRKGGFKEVGEQFDECGIMHYKMIL